MLRTILALVKKEFYQVRRDRVMLRMIFVMPLVQILLFGYVVSTDVKLIRVAVYDQDRSTLSREYLRALTAGDYFVVSPAAENLLAAEADLKRNRSDLALILPGDFSRRLGSGEAATVGLVVDGSNANSAAISLGYASTITQQFNARLAGVTPPLELRLERLFNPEGESVYFMVPGIVATLLTMITVLLTSCGSRYLSSAPSRCSTPCRSSSCWPRWAPGC
jgi:ABC-2 type transport system permease protein